MSIKLVHLSSDVVVAIIFNSHQCHHVNCLETEQNLSSSEVAGCVCFHPSNYPDFVAVFNTFDFYNLTIISEESSRRCRFWLPPKSRGWLLVGAPDVTFTSFCKTEKSKFRETRAIADGKVLHCVISYLLVIFSMVSWWVYHGQSCRKQIDDDEKMMVRTKLRVYNRIFYYSFNREIHANTPGLEISK